MERRLGGGGGLTWSHLASLGFTWIHLDSLGLLGLTWTHLDSLGLTWIHLDSLGFTWNHLDSLDFTLIYFDFIVFHLMSLEFTLFHLIPQGKRERPVGQKGKGRGPRPDLGPGSHKATKPHARTHDTKRFPGWSHSPQPPIL